MKCPKCYFRNSPDTRFCGQCGTELNPAEAPTETIQTSVRDIERGDLFAGRYEVVEGIGSGGMGKVYKVFDKKIHEMIALKLIKPEIGTDKAIIERFSQELKTARKITHRNVCRMFDIGEEAGGQAGKKGVDLLRPGSTVCRPAHHHHRKSKAENRECLYRQSRRNFHFQEIVIHTTGKYQGPSRGQTYSLRILPW